MSFTISPNMNLIVPTVGLEPGPTYATDIDNSLTIIDQHNHSTGSGVQITPSGLNLNADVSFLSNNATTLRSVRFSPQVSPISASAPDLGAIYVSGSDLYYNDVVGNQVRITQSGSVAGAAGTITGLPSGTASASYAAGVFTFQAATLTPANIDGGSLVLRNNVASSAGLTLSPPNALPTDYSLTLPALPAQTNVMTLDTSGNMSSVTWNVAAENVTRAIGSTVGLSGIAMSSSSGSFATSSSSYVAVTNLLVTVTTSSKPVSVSIQPSTSSGNSFLFTGNTNIAASGSTIRIRNTTNSSVIGVFPLSISAYPASITCIDFTVSGSGGVYSYIVEAGSSNSNLTEVVNCILVAYEL